MIEKFKAQEHLTILWISSTIVIGLFLFSFSSDVITENNEAIWSWYTRSTLPFNTLIITAMFAIKRTQNLKEIHIQKSYYFITLGVSVSYFLLIIVFILKTQTNASLETIQLISNQSNHIQTFFEAFVTGTLGYFFVTSGKIEE
ncbi:hypothetical protein [Algoriphagus chordae]|uniref:Uncharacterized protein n=1 Tax=Algoriphagus chordae TaxID=237019 RepID=A0A2W7QLV8_9BACT|nr:hypothetical protein [Algoriphagus chordae]PZX49111.1 hypothetical protein LV85_03242 [Algoriphagus chordae]